MNPGLQLLSDLVVHSKYAKYNHDKERYEIYPEVVERVEKQFIDKYPELEDSIHSAFKLVHQRKILPSMRLMQFAGKPVTKSPSRSFNCSYAPVDHYKVFSETMFLLLGGTGCGYSVEHQNIDKLPDVQNPGVDQRYIVEDSTMGWAEAIRVKMKAYFFGATNPIYDYSDVREKGAELITSGGKAPGPEPLRKALDLIDELLRKAIGRKLTSLEVHDIMCYIADAVLSGGIRRAAMICFFDKDDDLMMNCKTGNWWSTHPHRARANNSFVAYRDEFTKEDFDKWFKHVEESGWAEPGIFWTNSKTARGNPCVTADTWVQTSDGPLQVKDLIGTQFQAMVNGVEYSTTDKGFFYTGDKLVYEIETKDGHKVKATGAHQFLCKDGKWRDAIDLGGHDVCFHDHDMQVPFADTEYTLSAMPCSEVISVTPLGIEPVYDVTVPGPHAFDANGFYAHNCVEASLEPNTFCCLSEINAAVIDNQDQYNEAAQAASLIGTLQASLTDFHYLRPCWKEATDRDALIGVGLTGIASEKFIRLNHAMASQIVNQTNAYYAKKIGINRAARCTVIKPSGTTSIVVGSSSGIHPWHAPYFMRRMRIGKNEDVYKFLMGHVPQLMEDCLEKPDIQAVLSIPCKAPDGAMTRSEGGVALLERVDKFYKEWIFPGHNRGENTHSISLTVSIRDDEWDAVGKWLWDNRENYACASLANYDGGHYPQAPFEDISEDEYLYYSSFVEQVDFSLLHEEDMGLNRTGELACAGGACEISFV